MLTTVITNIEAITMKTALIDRVYLDDCTLGAIKFGNNRFFTLELPYIGNKVNVSSIPPGRYIAQYRKSPSNGDVIELKNVENRTYIQIHAGNYTSKIKGCILIGDSIKDINGDGVPDVTNSKATLKKLLEWAGDEEFVLLIN